MLKFTLLPLLFLGTATPVWACSQSNKDKTSETKDYQLTSNSQCFIFNNIGQEIDKITWSGQCQDGYASGTGTASMYSKGELMLHIDGEYQHGMVKDKGIITWDAENECEVKRYEGEFKDGNPFGQGITDFTDGNRYVGPTVPRGTPYKGVFTWGENSQWNGDRYEGEFISGQKHGFGTYTSGMFEEWRKQGITYKPEAFKYPTDFDSWEGYRYEGEWKDNNRNGNGSFISKAMKYDGQWRDDLKNGYGKAQWFENNTRYEGFWVDDTLEGKGKLTYENKYVYEGNFKAGKKNDNGKIVYQNGAWYEGEFLNNDVTGKGELHFVSGSVSKGSLINGRLWGFNTLTVPKSAYQLYIDKRSPLGKWINDNTFVEQGWYVDDKLIFVCQNEVDCKSQAKTDATKRQAIKKFEQKMHELYGS